jgi:hypothetical protein
MRKSRTTESVLKEQEKEATAARESAAVRKGSTALVADPGNPWTEIASELDRFIGSPFLRFNKQGEFAVSDTEVIPAGTRCVAHCDEIMLGWRKWQGGRLADTRMGRIADRYVPVQRQDLGDTDPDQWEASDDGVARDPWQFAASVPVTRCDTGESYVFSTSSKGGLRAINALTRAFGARVRDRGDAAGLPIVELRPDSYKHARYGRVFYPVLHVTTWTGPDGQPLSTAEDLGDTIPDFSGKAA